MRTFAVSALLLSACAAAGAAAAAPPAANPADALAQKFAEAADRPSLDYEMDMLRRARAEQAERKSAAKPAITPEPKPAASSTAATASAPKPEAASTAAPAPVPAPATTPPSAAEPKAFAPAKDAAADAPPLPAALPPAQAAQARQEPSATSATAPVPAATTPAAPPSASTAAPSVQTAPPTAAAVAPLLSTPAASATSQAPPVTPDATPPAAPTRLSEAQPSAKTAPAPASTAPLSQQATILLALEAPADPKATPDAIVCINDVCYVSQGMDAAATPKPRGEALALKSTADLSKNSCRAMDGCIYRNVTVPDDARITVVDLGTSGGNPTEAFSIAPDTSCKKEDGELVCDNALVTHNFRIWTVPEATAKDAGATLLEDAVASGLYEDDDPAASGK